MPSQSDKSDPRDDRLEPEYRSGSSAPLADSHGSDLPPAMSATLMGRLFAVPLLIVSVIVGAAVVVVLLFGSITRDRERPIAELLDILETSTGEKTVSFMLLPKEKELWQVARELALRLEKKDAELTTDELTDTTKRLADLLRRDAADSSEFTEMGRQKLHFVMRALALTESPSAVIPLADMLDDASPQTRREALASLGGLRLVPTIEQALPDVYRMLHDSDAVVRMVACASIAGIAKHGDDGAIQALQSVYFDEDREVKWNATLALARLGSDAGKSLLLDMLDRSYWENEVKARLETAIDAPPVEYPLPPNKVVEYLCAAIESGAYLDDPQVWTGIDALASDESPLVRDKVRQVQSFRAPGAAGIPQTAVLAVSQTRG